MSVIGWSTMHHHEMFDDRIFQWEGFRYFLRYCQHDPARCQTLIDRTSEAINSKYQHYGDVYKDHLEFIPELVAYSMFNWHVKRHTVLGKRKRITIAVRALKNLLLEFF
jgi:hypothetical protein